MAKQKGDDQGPLARSVFCMCIKDLLYRIEVLSGSWRAASGLASLIPVHCSTFVASAGGVKHNAAAWDCIDKRAFLQESISDCARRITTARLHFHIQARTNIDPTLIAQSGLA